MQHAARLQESELPSSSVHVKTLGQNLRGSTRAAYYERIDVSLPRSASKVDGSGKKDSQSYKNIRTYVESISQKPPNRDQSQSDRIPAAEVCIHGLEQQLRDGSRGHTGAPMYTKAQIVEDSFDSRLGKSSCESRSPGTRSAVSLKDDFQKKRAQAKKDIKKKNEMQFNTSAFNLATS